MNFIITLATISAFLGVSGAYADESLNGASGSFGWSHGKSVVTTESGRHSGVVSALSGSAAYNSVDSQGFLRLAADATVATNGTHSLDARLWGIDSSVAIGGGVAVTAGKKTPLTSIPVELALLMCGGHGAKRLGLSLCWGFAFGKEKHSIGNQGEKAVESAMVTAEIVSRYFDLVGKGGFNPMLGDDTDSRIFGEVSAQVKVIPKKFMITGSIAAEQVTGPDQFQSEVELGSTSSARSLTVTAGARGAF